MWFYILKIVLLHSFSDDLRQQVDSTGLSRGVKDLLFGDKKNIDNLENITIILAVYDYVQDSERF